MYRLKLLIADFLALPWSLLFHILNKKGYWLYWKGMEIANARISFSQFGEDIVVASYLRQMNIKCGVYVDAGACHPIRLSNTHLLYKQGWRGMNIEMDEAKIERFRRLRPHDHNVVAAVSNQRQTMRRLRYGPDSATNRISLEDEANLLSVNGEQPIAVDHVTAYTLTELLQASPFADQQIDYLNIDCEGHDYEVLEGLDLPKYRPKIITIEAILDDAEQRLDLMLSQNGYKCISTIVLTRIYVLESH